MCYCSIYSVTQDSRHLAKVTLGAALVRLHDFGVYYRVLRYARASRMVRNNFGHCIVGKIQDGHHLSDVKQ